MPVNVLIIRSLLNLYPFYGDDFKVECPTGSGKLMTLFEVAQKFVLPMDVVLIEPAGSGVASYVRFTPEPVCTS